MRYSPPQALYPRSASAKARPSSKVMPVRQRIIISSSTAKISRSFTFTAFNSFLLNVKPLHEVFPGHPARGGNKALGFQLLVELLHDTVGPALADLAQLHDLPDLDVLGNLLLLPFDICHGVGPPIVRRTSASKGGAPSRRVPWSPGSSSPVPAGGPRPG